MKHDNCFTIFILLLGVFVIPPVSGQDSPPIVDETNAQTEPSLETTIVEASPPVSYIASRPVRSNTTTPSAPLIINDSEPTMVIDSLVLTPSRVVESNFTAPFVVDTITATALIERSVRSVPEAFEQTPGVVVQKTAHGQGSPFIRGFTAYHNLFLIDGVRLNNSVFRSGPNQYWNTIDSQGLAAIELVKSQGSVLFGSDAVGGTVQALTRRPVYADEGFYSGGRTYSRFASAENSFIQRAEYSVSDAENYGFIIGGTYKDFGNIESADLGELPFTGYDEWDIDGKFEWYLNDDTLLTVFHQQVHLDDAWRVHKTRHGVSWAGTTVGNEEARILDQHRMLTYVKLEGDSYTNPWFDHYAYTISHHRQDEQQFRERNNGRTDVQGFTVNSYGADVQFDKFLNSTDLTYGASYYQDRIDSFRTDYNANGTVRNVSIQGPVGDSGTYHLGGVFINSSTELNERTRLDLGARYTYASADIGQVRDTATGNQISIKENWQNLVGSGRISYQVDDLDRYRVFGAISQSFRAPNLADLSKLDSVRTGEIETPSPGLDPENFLTYEIGVKANLDDLSATLSYYYTDIEGMIVRSPSGNIVDRQNEVIKSNAGDGYVHGVEMTFNYGWTEQVEIFGGIAYQNSRISNFPTSAPILADEYISRVMPTNGYLGARWTSADERFWLEGITRIVDHADRLSSGDVRDTSRIPPGGTPGYNFWTLRSGWQATDNLKITSAVENIFDEDYRAHGSGQNEPGVNFIIGAEVTF